MKYFGHKIFVIDGIYLIIQMAVINILRKCIQIKVSQIYFSCNLLDEIFDKNLNPSIINAIITKTTHQNNNNIQLSSSYSGSNLLKFFNISTAFESINKNINKTTPKTTCKDKQLGCTCTSSNQSDLLFM